MTDAPDIRYARTADGVHIAYQVSGDGPHELVLGTGGLDLLAEDPGFIRVRRRLTAFSRTVWFEGRGLGASEGDLRDVLNEGVFDTDLTAVLDTVGFERPAIVGQGEGGALVIKFSVTHPERVSALVLVNTHAHYVREDGYPWGVPPERLDLTVALLKERWGTGAGAEFLAPSRISDEGFRAWFARSTRYTGGPDQMAEGIRASWEQDVRPLLPFVSVPTLVLHREGNRWIQLGAGQYLAEHIPNAKFVVLSGDDHMFYVGDTDVMVDEIEEFLTGARSGADADIIMAAVLFTDIVASTEHQSRVGPREWSRLTDRHEAMVRAALSRHRGHEVKTTGDGFLATFDATGRALRCASDIVAGAKDIGLDLRAGVHTGDVEVRGDDIAGLTVTIAKRVCDLAGSGEVLVSPLIPQLVLGSGIEFADRGDHQLKGVPGTWRLCAVAAASS